MLGEPSCGGEVGFGATKWEDRKVSRGSTLGERLIDLQGREGSQSLTEAMQRLGGGRSSVYLYRQRVRFLSQAIPDAVTLERLLTLSRGRGLVVQEFEKRPDGSKKFCGFKLSDYFVEAMRHRPMPKPMATPSVKESWARDILALTSRNRTAGQQCK